MRDVLGNFPNGTDVFLDANILLEAFRKGLITKARADGDKPEVISTVF